MSGDLPRTCRCSDKSHHATTSMLFRLEHVQNHPPGEKYEKWSSYPDFWCSYSGWLRNPNHQVIQVIGGKHPIIYRVSTIQGILLVVQDFAGPSTV